MLAASWWPFDLKFLSELVRSLVFKLRFPVDSFIDKLCFILTLALDLNDTFGVFLKEKQILENFFCHEETLLVGRIVDLDIGPDVNWNYSV